MAVGIVASASSGSQASVASFNISASLGTGARAGLVFVVTYGNSGAAIESGVTWNSATMTLLGSGADTNTEPGIVRAYFLDNISNGAVTVTRTNNTVVCVGYAIAISAASAAIVSQFKTVGGGGTVTTNGNTSESGTAASNHYAVDDNSPGTNSMRFAAAYTGAATPVAANAGSSTGLQTDDQTAFGSSLVRETTAGQGSRNVGFATGTTDDWAVVAVAVSEQKTTTIQPAAASFSISGATPSVVIAAPVLVQPAAASVSVAGATPAVATPILIQPGPVGGANYSTTILADSPMAYWRLGEPSGTTADNAEGTSALDGTYYDTPTLGVTGALTGDSDTAATFNGSSEYVGVAANAAFDYGTSAYSIEFWFKTTSRSTMFAVENGAYEARGIEAYWNGDILSARVGGTAPYVESGGTAGALANGAWHHAVIVMDRPNTTGQWYVDGSPSGSAVTISATGGLNASADGLYIGKRVNGLYWSGSLDEVAIYKSALSSSQVAAHYTAGTTAPSGLTIAGATPTVAVVVADVVVQPAAAVVGVAGATPAIVAQNYILLQPAAASVTIGTATPDVGTPVSIAPAAGAVELAGATPAVLLPVTLAVGAAAVSVGTATPAVATPVLIQPAAAAVTIDTATPAVSATQTYTPAAVAVAVDTATPAVSATQTYSPAAVEITVGTAIPAVATPVVIQPDAAAVTVDGDTPTVVAENYILLQPAAAAVAIAGATPAIVAQDYRLIEPNAAAVTIATAAPAILPGFVPAAAEIAIAGAVPNINVTLGTAIQPDPAVVTITTATPDIAAPQTYTPAAVAVALAGATPAVVTDVLVQPGATAVTIATATPTVVGQDYQLVQPAAAAASITGAVPTVVAEGNVLVQPAAASVGITTATPAVTATAHVWALPDPAVLAIGMATPNVVVSETTTIQPDAAAILLTAFAPTVVVTNDIFVSPSAAAIAIAMAAPSVATTANVLALPAAAKVKITGVRPTVTTTGVTPPTPSAGRPYRLAPIRDEWSELDDEEVILAHYS